MIDNPNDRDEATTKLTQKEDARLLADEVDIVRQGQVDELAAALAERDEARLRLLSAAGDDLCRLTPGEIKALSSGAVKIPPKEEFLASCERFHSQVAREAGVLGNCLTLAQLIAENEKLRAEVERLNHEVEAYASSYARSEAAREAAVDTARKSP